MFYAYQHRGSTRDIVIKDANGGTITPEVMDKVRVIIGREDEVEAIGNTVIGAKLVVVSGSPTANGSTITKGSTNRLRLDAADLDFKAGSYSLWVELFDCADDGEWKTVERQVFCLEST